MDPAIDRIDLHILTLLQKDGRLSNSELAERVGLSESPCLRRVRRLEQQGYITGYYAHLDAKRLGRGLTVYVGVKVRRHTSDEVRPFEDWARAHSEIASCFLVSGDFDYLLYVVVADLDAYETFLTSQLLQNPAIADIRSMIGVRAVKAPFGTEVDPAYI